MYEQELLKKWEAAHTAYEKQPSRLTAVDAFCIVSKLVAISDDYQDLLDEAYDMLSDGVTHRPAGAA